MIEVMSKRWAAVYANEQFVCVETCSGLRRYGSDPAGKVFFAKSGDPPAVLGQALVEALSASRILRADEIAAFFDTDAMDRRYEKWVADVMHRFGYDSRSSLFKHMKHCAVEQANGQITIRPTYHEKLEAWSSEKIDKSQIVQVPADSASPAVGEAVLLALSRCIE